MKVRDIDLLPLLEYISYRMCSPHTFGYQCRYTGVCLVYLVITNKMLSYRRETALQCAL